VYDEESLFFLHAVTSKESYASQEVIIAITPFICAKTASFGISSLSRAILPARVGLPLLTLPSFSFPPVATKKNLKKLADDVLPPPRGVRWELSEKQSSCL
jgi:hypothetical protein